MQRAAEYYRKVITIARKEPDLYDPDFEDYYKELIERLDPTIQGALPPNVAYPVDSGDHQMWYGHWRQRRTHSVTTMPKRRCKRGSYARLWYGSGALTVGGETQ